LHSLIGEKELSIATKLVSSGRTYKLAPLTDDEFKKLLEVIPYD